MLENRVNDIFLLMLNLTQVQEIDLCKRVFVESMASTYSKLKFSFTDTPCPDAGSNIPVKIRNINYKNLAIHGNMAQYNREDQMSLRNAVKMFSIILENKFQAKMLAETNIELKEIIKENQAILASMTKMAPLIIYIYDLVKRASIYANKEIYHALGYNKEYILSTPDILKKTVHPSDINLVMEHHKELSGLDLGEIREVQYRMRDADNRWQWLLSKDTPYKKDEKGKTFQILGCAIIITDRIRAERERENLLFRLKHKNEELESIIYVTSHDLRSPLVNIQGFAHELSFTYQQLKEMIETMVLNPETAGELDKLINQEIGRDLDYIVQSTNKIDSILKGLLKLSRIGRTNIRVMQIDMNKMFDNIIGEMQYQLKQNHIKIEYGSLPPCLGDETQINQVFTNIIDNAVKYKYPGREPLITINFRKSEKYVTYIITDNGIGFDQLYKNKIFEIFQRMNESSTITGQGLGLTIVKRIVDRHNGKIEVESVPGEGSRFYISLPAPEDEYNILS